MMENEDENFGTQRSYLGQFRKTAEQRRDQLMKTLADFGMTVTVPEGGYYVIANWTSVADKIDLSDETDDKMDVRFVKWMIKNVRVLALPISGFYNEKSENLREDYVRFSFIKVNIF